uniref:Phlebovirus glycoprotein G2 fusion domain-containing protein n=1 Tax=Caenorhabditis japonica TaxID=281687 RepID=A0A8R1IKS2_CAEJA
MVGKVTRQRRTRANWRDIVVLCTILCLTEQGQGCQEIDILQQIETVCDNTGHCEYFTETGIHLNHVHSEGCIRMGKKGTTLRDIRIQLMDIEAICTKRTITYTQDIITKVWSTKRCPRMGTCQGEKCKAIKPDSRIPELNNVNMMKYQEKFDFFDCIEYQQVARTQLTITKLNSINNTAKSIEIRSPIGHLTTFHQSTVTVDTIQTPPSPILNTWFIKNNESVATWTPNQRPNFQCDNLLKNCTLQEKCECQPAENQMRCTCLDNDIGHLLQRPTTHLPIRSGYWLLEPFGKSVKGRILTESTVFLTLRMTDIWNTKIVKTEKICQSENAIAEGCYSCAPGATAQIHCKSQKEDTMAELECEEESFVIPCSPDVKSTNITFHAAKS